MASNEHLSDHHLHSNLAQQQALACRLRSLATEQGFAWLFDPEAEAIQAQANVAYLGYQAYAAALEPAVAGAQASFRRPRFGRGHQLATSSPDRSIQQADFNQLLEASLNAWSKPNSQTGKSTFDYCRSLRAADPELKIDLVPVPNRCLGHVVLGGAAIKFGQVQPDATWIFDKHYDKGQTKLYARCRDELLSGTPHVAPNGSIPAVRFELRLSKPNPELANKTQEQQRQELVKLQAAHPEARLHVPSVSAGISRWFGLRAAQLATYPDAPAIYDAGTFEATIVRHIDLDIKAAGGDRAVPLSYVSDDGRPSLYASFAKSDGDASLAVG